MNASGFYSRRAWGACLVVAASVAASACGVVGRQLAISSIDRCIEDHCKAEQGKARQQCTMACQRQYGR